MKAERLDAESAQEEARRRTSQLPYQQYQQPEFPDFQPEMNPAQQATRAYQQAVNAYQKALAENEARDDKTRRSRRQT